MGQASEGPTVSKPQLREQLRYKFDNVMARGTPALIGLLGIASLVLVLVVGTIANLFATEESTGSEGGIGHWLWNSMLRTLDPGTMGGDTGGPLFLGLMLLVTIGGIFIVAALVGILNTGLEARLDELRKGRSRVVESDHTVLLGWSDQIHSMVQELVMANESERRACVAILADKDKVEMEDELRVHVGSTKTTRVVCRTGSPTDLHDLGIVNLSEARSVIVVSPDGDDSDAYVVKTLLALSSHRWDEHRPHVVAAVHDVRNLSAARLAGGEHATVVDADDIAARLVVRTCRQAGLSVVTSDLLDFNGDEIYMQAVPDLVGVNYGDALHAYATATVIGVHRSNGTVALNPPMASTLLPGDSMILVAEDDSTIERARQRPPVAAEAIRAVPPVPEEPDRVLMLGWNKRAIKVVEQLDWYLPNGSELLIASQEADENVNLDALRVRLWNLSIGHKQSDVTQRASLERLDPGSYAHLIVLADDHLDDEQADSRTLMTLLHLRDMQAGLDPAYSIVSEMNDERNRELAQLTRADDFVVSGKLISLLLTQLSENRHLVGVFNSLLDASGSEIYLRPAENYVRLREWLNFSTVIEAARHRGETALGYRLRARSQLAPNFGVRINPDKHNPLMLDHGDRVIVLAEQ